MEERGGNLHWYGVLSKITVFLQKMTNCRYKISLVVVMVFLGACSRDEISLPQPSRIRKFLHLGHTYVQGVTEPRIDPRIRKIEFNNYDMLLLGGDMTAASSAHQETVTYIDRIFDIKSPNTLWAIGNHDYDHPEFITAITQRPRYYATWRAGITFLVLDTQDSLSNFTGDQMTLIRNVTDTISVSRHLIMLTHKLVWMMDEGYLQSAVDSTANGNIGSCFYCTNPNNFYRDVYPLLVTVKNKNIGVVCIAGDIGYHTSAFSYLTSEGIRFLASGICTACTENYGLVLSYNPEDAELKYEFRSLEDL